MAGEKILQEDNAERRRSFTKRKSELCLYSRVKLWKIDSPPKLSIQLAKVSEPMSAQVCFSGARGIFNHFNISRMYGRTKNETINA